ncbi:MAG: HAD hydrolase-like protein [Alphaproteobacteria bacterium]|jgi:putative hydrolase of the HAD superfamily|nr:HAD hydrolase-like protein [Alphaproteobacteria bacterium]
MITTIGFDGDDTLWHNESIFSMTQDKFRQLLLRYVPGLEIDKILYITELRNLKLFGYGIKGFTLSMIETAIEVSQGRVGATDIQRIIDFGKAMLEHPVELIEGAAPTLDRLRGTYQLILITKGDLFDQESKLARSGLADGFSKIEILSEKDERTYRHLLDRHGVPVENFLMVGNSLKSDVLPVLSIGGQAVHVPYPVTWIHEEVHERRRLPSGYRTLSRLAELPGLLEELDTHAVAAEPG